MKRPFQGAVTKFRVDAMNQRSSGSARAGGAWFASMPPVCAEPPVDGKSLAV